MTKFYHADNSNRRIRSKQGGLAFTFEPYGQFAGTWRGILMTEKPEEIAALDDLALDPGTAVTEISQEEYEAKGKKKVTVSDTSSKSNPPPPVAIKGQGAVVVENPLPAEVEEIESGETVIPVADALQAEQVAEPAQPLAPPAAGKGGKKKNRNNP